MILVKKNKKINMTDIYNLQTIILKLILYKQWFTQARCPSNFIIILTPC